MMIPKSLLRWHSSQWEGGNERAILTISKHSTRKRDIPTFWRQMARVNQPISSTLSAQTVCCAELYGMSASPPKASWESWRSLCRWKTGVSRRDSSVPCFCNSFFMRCKMCWSSLFYSSARWSAASWRPDASCLRRASWSFLIRPWCAFPNPPSPRHLAGVVSATSAIRCSLSLTLFENLMKSARIKVTGSFEPFINLTKVKCCYWSLAWVLVWDKTRLHWRVQYTSCLYQIE